MFKIGTTLTFELEDEYNDGCDISVYIDETSNFKIIYQSKIDILKELKIETCRENILLLMDLLEIASYPDYSFDNLGELYQLIHDS